MKPEMLWLLAAVALAFAQMLLAVQGAMMQVGLPMLAGDRENLPAITVISGKSSAMTLLGAPLFFWARLAYAGVYVAGIPWLRTGVWAVSAAGMILIFLQLI